jgi:hypothetical protein
MIQGRIQVEVWVMKVVRKKVCHTNGQKRSPALRPGVGKVVIQLVTNERMARPGSVDLMHF